MNGNVIGQMDNEDQKGKENSNSWQNGRAFCIAEMLLNKYRPKENLCTAVQKKRLISLDFEMGQDPDKLCIAITQLELITRTIWKKVIKWIRL